MPTDEPSRAGLTQHGSPSASIRAAAPSTAASSTATKPTCGSPARAISSLNSTLSMHSALDSTPEPTYGTSSSSSSPWTVPSSPNGPCSAGNTASQSSSPRPGLRPSSTPSWRHVPSRASSTHTTSWPASRSPSPTDAAEFSETSCSDERPRRGRPPSRRRRGRRRARVRRGRLARRRACVEPPDGQRHRRAALDLAARRVLLDDDTVALLRVDLLLDDLDLEAVLRQPLHRVVLRLPRDVGDLDLLRLLRDCQRHRRALVDLLVGAGALLEHGAGVLVVRDLVAALGLEPTVLQVLGRRVELLARDVGDLDLLDAGRQEQDHLRALLEPRLGRRARADRLARGHLVRALAALLDLKARALQARARLAARQPADRRHGRGARPARDVHAHGGALVGLRAAGRVRADHRALGPLRRRL